MSEYDPNPLSGKRRRQRLSEEKRSLNDQVSLSNSQDQITNNNYFTASSFPAQNISEAASQKSDDAEAERMEEEYRERKRMKKRKRKLKRLKTQEGKRKHKKHRSSEEHRKHKHRKHRKHKHKHHNSANSEASNTSSGESNCEQKNEEEANQNLPSTSTYFVAPSSQEETIQNSSSTNSNFIAPTSEDVTIQEAIQNLPSTSAGFVAPSSEKVSSEETSQSEQTTEETSSSYLSSEWEPDSVKRKKQARAKQMKANEKPVDNCSKIAPFLPEEGLWFWADDPYRRTAGKGRYRKQFHRIITREDKDTKTQETIKLGDSALFMTSKPYAKPYIGKIISMWESSNGKIVKIKWYYHPEERKGCPQNLKYPGGLFESNHLDENDVQTIAQKCEVLPYKEYVERMGDRLNNQSVDSCDSRDLYYQAGTYDPTTCTTTLCPDVV